MQGRVDEERYAVATTIQQNFIPLKQGPAMFRPGTAYVQAVKNSANRTWLVRFEYAQTQGYLIEFGDKYARFYTNHGALLYPTPPNWSNATAYNPGDMVLNPFPIGNAYLCILANTNQAPPNATYWYPLPGVYEIPTPYAVADLTDSLGEFTLQIVQSGDVLYIAGGAAGTGYSPQTLTRYANNPPKWIMAPYAPTDGPFSNAAPIVTNYNVALGVSALQGNGITITAYGNNQTISPTFQATDVGRLVRIDSQTFNTTPWAANVAWTVNTYASYNGNNYQALNSATTGYSPPVHTSGSVQDGPSGVNWLYIDSGYGIAQITAVTDAYHVTANVLKRFPVNTLAVSATVTAITRALPAVVTATQSFTTGSPVVLFNVVGMTQINQNAYTSGIAAGATVTLPGVDSTGFTAYSSGGTIIANCSLEWQLGAWSNTTEWPRAVDFFKDRLFWAGKLKLWGSVPGLYTSHTEDFFGQVTTDSAINVVIATGDASNICWIKGAIILLIGTEGGEYGLDAANYSASPLGPSNVEVLRQSNWRCRHIRPELVGTSVLYVQRAGRKVFAMDYQLWLNRYDSTDQSKYAYHISIGGLTSIAMQQEPWSILWATRADGTLLSYTFNREDQVTAWARHNLGGNGVVESIAVIPAPDGLRDEVWMIVNRTINGATVRSVEYMVKHYEGPQAGYAGDAQSSCWYVDMGGTVTGSNITTVTASWLIGATVAILADGGVQPQQVVPNTGIIPLAGSFSTVTVGLPYQGNLCTIRPEGGAEVGTAQGKLKQGANLVLRLVDSAGGVMGQYTTTGAPILDYIRYNDTATPLGTPPPILSGDFPVSFPHNPVTDQDARDFMILVQQNDPLPMTVAGLFPSYEVSEPR
jgi:hypothetical protein